MVRGMGQDAACHLSSGECSQTVVNITVYPPTAEEFQMQRCLDTQHGRYSAGRLLAEGHGSVLSSCPLLTKCYSWIQISSNAPVLKGWSSARGCCWEVVAPHYGLL